MKIGDTIYHFDARRRIYADVTADPIYGHHWVEVKIIGETSRSWLVGYAFDPTKLAKKELAEGKLASYKITKEEVDEDIYVHTHRHKIVNKIQYCKDYKMLKAIADIIGYEP